jgi:2-polyprenyl-3-methyl-5-hydroxy-6-metoxy-1,4-benzoquinol methylase
MSESYYLYQAAARGIHGEKEIEEILEYVGPVYDRCIAKWLPTDRRAAVYEAACGPGIMLRWLKRNGYTNVTGSDLSESYLTFARSVGFPLRHVDSLADLRDVPAATFDVVLAIDFIEHLPREALLEFIRYSAQALKPNGVLIIRGPNGDSPFVGRNLFNDITHCWAYTSIAFRALTQIAGFRECVFVDDTIVSVYRQRWLKVPLMKLVQLVVKAGVRLATRESIEMLGSSYYACARK